MSKLILHAGTSCALAALGAAQAVLTVCRDDDLLRTVDPMTGATVASVAISEPAGRAINGANGLAYDLISGRLWAILKIQGAGRTLAHVDPATGAATPVGMLPDSFANLAFDLLLPNLYGVTGDGATTGETLYTLDQTNASATFVMSLGNGTDGESIAIHPWTGVMYHASGYSGVRNVDRIFESVDPVAGTTSPIRFFGFDESEILAMTFWVGDTLLAADLNEDLLVLQMNGGVTHLSTLDHSAKGLVFLPPPLAGPFYSPYGDNCPDAAGFSPLVAGSTAPAPGATVRFWMRNAPGGAPAAILLGAGNTSFPIPLPPGCSMSIFPLLPPTLPLTLGGTLPSEGDGSIQLGIPLSTSMLDLYLQGAIIDGGSVLLSNGLQVHVP